MQTARARPRKVKPRLPHPALPQADWADCFQLSVPVADLTAVEAARLVLGYSPFWVRTLMALRNVIVGPLGLKTSAGPLPDDVERIGLFPIVSKSGRQVVLGFDDRHLDFRIVIEVTDVAEGKRVSAMTLVKRKILIGRIYIAAITPFHNLIVSSMLTDMGRRVGALSSPPSA